MNLINPRSCKYTAPNHSARQNFLSHSQPNYSHLTYLGLAVSIILSVRVPVEAMISAPSRPLAQNPSLQLLAQTKILFVNVTNGQDTPNNGSDRAPLKTISYALNLATPNTVILIAPGTYSNDSGETFPLKLKPGITIQGDPGNHGQNIIIKGGGLFISPSFAEQNITILGENQAGLTGVTVVNPNDRGYGVWIESTSPIISDNTFTGNNHDGVSIMGSSTSIIRNNYFYQNGANGITIYGTAQPEIRENIFDQTGYGINIAQNATPVLVSNRITKNRSGVVAQANSRPILRKNVIEGNLEDGVVAIANAQPDLGTTREQGGNILRNNGKLDIDAKATKQIIPAFGNQITSGHTNGRIDLGGNTTITSVPIEPQIATNIPVTAPSNPQFSLPPVQVIQLSPPQSSTPVVSKQIPSRELSPIPIPVPQPNTQVTSTSKPVNLVVPSPRATELPTNLSRSNINPDLPTLTPGVLPVPSPDIPIGYQTTLPTPVDLNQTTSGNPPPPPNPVTIMGFRYRVVVEIENDRQEAKVKKLVPDAFERVFQGRTVIQVGAYRDREQDKAEWMLKRMTSNGFRATVEQLQ